MIAAFPCSRAPEPWYEGGGEDPPRVLGTLLAGGTLAARTCCYQPYIYSYTYIYIYIIYFLFVFVCCLEYQLSVACGATKWSLVMLARSVATGACPTRNISLSALQAEM